MKKTLKVNYRGYELIIICARECGIETWLVYVDHHGVSQRGRALSEASAITIGKNYINGIAI